MGLKSHRIGRMLVLTLDSPQSRNALSAALLGEINAAFDRAEADPAIRVVAIAAEGASFCSGADLAGGRDDAPGEAARLYFQTLRRMTTSSLIVVSVVDGEVQAGGMGLVAASDYVLCSEGASFRLPEVLLGLIPACVMPFLIRRVGVHRGRMLALTAQRIGAERALEMGLADQLAADVNDALRRFLLSVERTPEPAVAALKAYMERLAPISDREEALAVASIASLMDEPGSLDRVQLFANHGLWATGGER